jgi:hypothetical protein
VAYTGFCKCCALVFKNIVFPQTSKEIWNSVNLFIKVPCWEMESGFDPLKVKVRENPARVALGRRCSIAYNTIPIAEEVLNGDVYCTLSD